MRPVESHGEAVALSGGDAWLRFAVRPDEGFRAWHDADAGLLAVARRRPRAGDVGLVLLPTSDGEPATALGAARPLLAHATSLTLPRTAADDAAHVLGLVRDDGVGWDWMWTTGAPPPHPAEPEVRVLDATDPAVARALTHLLTRFSPRHSATPRSGDATGWVGVHRGGRLVACAARLEPVPGVPLLASVAVHPDVRRGGLGAAVTTAITRAALAAGAPAVTVDLYADNDPARRLYAGLGFRTAHEFTSYPVGRARRRPPG